LSWQKKYIPGKSILKRVNYCKVWLQNVVKCGKYRLYSLAKFANFVYFCIACGNYNHMWAENGSNSAYSISQARVFTSGFSLQQTSLFQIVLVVATGTVGYFVKEHHDFIKEALGRLGDGVLDPYDFCVYGRYELFFYTTSVGVIIAILSLVASITGLLEKHGGTLAVSCCKY
jgi:hypothetical protein